MTVQKVTIHSTKLHFLQKQNYSFKSMICPIYFCTDSHFFQRLKLRINHINTGFPLMEKPYTRFYFFFSNAMRVCLCFPPCLFPSVKVYKLVSARVCQVSEASCHISFLPVSQTKETSPCSAIQCACCLVTNVVQQRANA